VAELKIATVSEKLVPVTAKFETTAWAAKLTEEVGGRVLPGHSVR
jgi:hypothetical protein